MNTKKQTQEELNLNENDLADWAEKKLGGLKPYASHIALGIALIFAAFVAITYFIDSRNTAYADQWRELSLANTDHQISQNTTRLLNVADDYPNQRAAMWSLQIAGDSDLQKGLAQFSYDRENAFTIVERARDNLQRVVDASSSIKSDELHLRGLFSLAYAHESLGAFDKAKETYQTIVDDFPKSAFAEPATRGVERTSNPEIRELYTKFKDWKDVADVAPGPNVPESPNIEFEDIDVDPTVDDTEGETESTDFDPESKEDGSGSTDPENADATQEVDEDATGDANEESSDSTSEDEDK